MTATRTATKIAAPPAIGSMPKYGPSFEGAPPLWNSGYTESVYTFANTINTHEGGTHEEGFRAALTSIVNKYARDQKLLREKGKLDAHVEKAALDRLALVTTVREAREVDVVPELVGAPNIPGSR